MYGQLHQDRCGLLLYIGLKKTSTWQIRLGYISEHATDEGRELVQNNYVEVDKQ